jgi:uncharacterized protein
MPEVVADTSPLQYLHQMQVLDLLPRLYGRLIVPTAVKQELERGVLEGYDVPQVDSLPWVEVRKPADTGLHFAETELGRGEQEVLMLCVASPGSLAILDDALARHYARLLGVTITGTLGILLKAKQAGLVPAVRPLVGQLPALGFYLDAATRQAVLKLAAEDR